MSDETQAHSEHVVVEHLMVPMRDGIRLATDVFRSAGPGRFPVLLARWPYGIERFRLFFDLDSLARHGYAVVVQHCRGCFDSEGDFAPVFSEIVDGYDAVEWVAEQPWSNGKVGMFGGSYGGLTQWEAAIARPPHLAAMSPATTSSDFFDGFPFLAPGIVAIAPMVAGASLMAAFAAGPLGIADPILERLPSAEDMAQVATEGPQGFVALQSRFEDVIGPLTEFLMRHPPLRRELLDKVALLKRGNPMAGEMLAHTEPDDPFWHRYAPASHHHEIDVPALHITGWYDALLKATIHNYTGMTAHAPSAGARRGQRLIIGPWHHRTVGQAQAGVLEGRLGVMRFFEDTHVDIVKSDLIRFFDRWLKEADMETAGDAPVCLFVMGDNAWRDEQEWPLARTVWTSYFLHSKGAANTLDDDGVLSFDKPTQQPPDRYLYDPSDPVPSRGGPVAGLDPGPFDQRTVEGRPDVLVYTSSALSEDLEVTGPVALELWASSSAPDTDFTAKLVDVYPDGRAINLCEGIVRARYSAKGSLRLIAEAVYRFDVDLWATSNVFKAGHRIRLEVSSSCFPKAEPNPNTGEDGGHSRTASQVVYHDPLHPSRLILPVIPR